MNNKIKEILKNVNSIDLSLINVVYYMEVVEKSGKWSRWADKDLDLLVNMVYNLFGES